MMRAVHFVLAVALMAPATAALAQSEVHKHESPAAASSPSDAQKSFDLMKTFAGEWEGSVKTDMPIAAGMDGTSIHVTMRVTSRGNVVVNEFQEANTPFDPKKYDHPVTMFYLDSDQLNLVHYCDAGNRPHMTGKMSPDGNVVEFEFADLGGSDKTGHMHHAIFTAVDENRHIEEWIYKLPDGQSVHARFDLHRVK